MQKIEYINVHLLHPHPDNPRKDLGDITELAESIRAKGVLQNLTVVPDKVDGGYRIIIGHRRHAAAKLAGLTDLPCVIADMTPQEQFETMMVENVHRSDLTVYEQAEGFQMMLDMGGSVEEVSQKTGFSETTIRNRVKLLKLDRKEFQKAEERGATMTDYLKLTAIQDPDRRNSVLKTIGTSEFNNSLKNAIADEELDARMDRVRNYFWDEQDWCRERTDEEVGYGEGQYSYYTAYDKYHTDDPKRPDNADTVDYIWSITAPNTVTIYKKNPKSSEKAPLSLKGQRKQQLRDDLEEIKSELNSISKTHLELRDDFIHDFTAVNTYEMDIQAFAAKAMLILGNGYVHRMDTDRLGNLLGVSRGSKGILDEAAMNRQLFNRPQYTLLCATYTMLEKDGQKYNGFGNWIIDVGFPPNHEKNPTLDLIYEGLVSMGYEMSEEEKQMQDGSHPLYQKEKGLVAEYEKEGYKC
ncbi:MAG: ParB/RepB/Spo0J family partition protein [Faecousia sp.]